MGAAKLELAEGFRRLPSTSAICSRKILGGITIETKDHGPIEILLHANQGFLVEMEVIWFYFPKPFPKSWVEVSRTVDPLH